jgi:DNA-binding NtrC family response regulator
VLARHTFPGNVRELENILGHACMMAKGTAVDVSGFTRISAISLPPSAGYPNAGRRADSRFEHFPNGNQTQAARALRIGRDALRYKMRTHGLL